jgi:UDP-N-acetylmuramate-alanine ligase
VPEKARVVGELTRLTRPGDVLLTVGAGDVVRFGEEFLARG